MKKSIFRFYIFFFLFSSLSFSQTIKEKKHVDRCGTYQYNQELLKEHPNMMGSKVFEEKLKSLIEAYKTQRTANSSKMAIITIPVVVHVLHNGEPIGIGPNISDAQVLSQITVLNEDFRKIAGKRGDGGGEDVEVQFCLAKQDLNGCPTNGINRVNIGQDGINESSQSDAISQMNVLKPASIWDSSLYMNMWSVKFTGGSGLLGYAQLPGGGISTDGVVSDYKFFGSDDDPNVTIGGRYNLGRTMTHEVGHFLGLKHTWGDNWDDGDPDGESCGFDDDIADTPDSGKPNYGCPDINPNTCDEGADDMDDMIENYMDYSDDVCFDTFTAGQKDRIQAVLGDERSSLASSSKCDLVSGENDDASVSVVFLDTPDCSFNMIPSIRITNWGDNPLTSATLLYDVDGTSLPVYNWSGSSLAKGQSVEVNLPSLVSTIGGHTFNISITSSNGNLDQRSCNDSDSSNFIIDDTYPTITEVRLELLPDDFGSEITWIFKNSSNSINITGGPYTDGDRTAINETFNVSSGDCYTFTIFDDPLIADGLCCNDPGSYTLKTDDDSIIFSSSGSYGASEATNISTTALSTDEFFIDNGVRIYPNPTSNILNIKLARGNDLPDGYKLYNMLGQLIKQDEINHTSQLKIDVSAISKGMYFVKIFKEDRSISLPFIKN